MVTGGTRGIGRAIAARLLREGVSVAICGRSSTAVANAVADLGHSEKARSAERMWTFQARMMYTAYLHSRTSS